MQTFQVMGIEIDALSMDQALARVQAMISAGTSGHVVTFANVHMLVEAQTDLKLRKVLESSDLNCPDGKPISWIGRHLYNDQVSQVAGPEFMPLFCELSKTTGHSHFFYGGAPGTAQKASLTLSTLYPGIVIAGVYSPPFRELTPSEDEEVCRRIDESGADIVWVSLGCPKQEKWMYDHQHRLKAKVLLGIGQALDLLAGTTERAPALFRLLGLEWSYRLLREPRRLWRRYLVTNFLFLWWLALRPVSYWRLKQPQN